MNDQSTPFEIIAAELRALGLTLQRLPGEYRVNLLDAIPYAVGVLISGCYNARREFAGT